LHNGRITIEKKNYKSERLESPFACIRSRVWGIVFCCCSGLDVIDAGCVVIWIFMTKTGIFDKQYSGKCIDWLGLWSWRADGFLFHPVTDDIYNRRLDVEIIMSRHLERRRRLMKNMSLSDGGKKRKKDHSSFQFADARGAANQSLILRGGADCELKRALCLLYLWGAEGRGAFSEIMFAPRQSKLTLSAGATGN